MTKHPKNRRERMQLEKKLRDKENKDRQSRVWRRKIKEFHEAKEKADDFSDPSDQSFQRREPDRSVLVRDQTDSRDH